MFASGPESLGILERLRALLAGEKDIYVVGGAVRDMLLGKPLHDIDLILPGNVKPLARKVADKMQAAFYMLDDERDTARVIEWQNGSPLVIDFAAFRAADLEGDLRARDFTINAMALPLGEDPKLIDPLGGAADLRAGLLRACSPGAFQDDPLRVLRGVRLAVDLGFRIDPGAFRAMRIAAAELSRVSAERKRDELFRMLDGKRASAAVRILDRAGALEMIMPELLALKGVDQPLPHTLDAWEHTLNTLEELELLLEVLVGEYPAEGAANFKLGLAVLRLGRYREQLAEHFSRRLNPNRSLRSLLFFAALYHDAGKPAAKETGKDGRIHFYQHETLSARLATRRGRELALSQLELGYLERVIRNHMQVHMLVMHGKMPGRRSIYRFFRAAGEEGVDVCLLSLADVLATYRVMLTGQHWLKELDVCRELLEAYWEKPEEAVQPPRLLTGSDLIEHFRLKPGPLLGRALEAVREAQAMGKVSDREQALSYVHGWLGSQPQGVLEKRPQKDRREDRERQEEGEENE